MDINLKLQGISRNREMAQSKGQNKSPKADPKEMEVYELPDKVTIIKMHNDLRKMTHEQNELKKETENIFF